MMSRIDPLRRAALTRRTPASEVDGADDAERSDLNLPVPVGPARTVPPKNKPAAGDAAFNAQLLGQEGQKRGLRAGPMVIDTAKATYNRTEYSGRHDRRARKGRAAKTEV
jgi:hypothetical protein